MDDYDDDDDDEHYSSIKSTNLQRGKENKRISIHIKLNTVIKNSRIIMG